MNRNHYCVIMAGGHGNRFWPISRENTPKQFLDINGTGKSLVRMAYERCLGVVPQENILIVTLSKYSSLVQEQVSELPPENLLLEPYGRRTAPCIAYATYSLLKRNTDAVVAVTPADLVIEDIESYRTCMRNALDYVTENAVLMTLGIIPSRPDPNFGYIQISGGKNAVKSNKPLKVKTFTEKPDSTLAEVFYKSGEFFWNSGVFLWQADVIRQEMERYIPEITMLFNGWQEVLGTSNEKSFLEKVYTDCTKLSIDYGVMEKTERAWLYPVRFGWSDIDSWDAMYEDFPDKDKDGNASNSTRQYFENSRGNIVISDNKNKLMAVNGMENFIIVDTDDVLMICPKDEKTYRDFIAGTAMPGYEDFR